MNGFAYLVRDHAVEEVTPAAAIATDCHFTWIHLAGIGDETSRWLRESAHADPLVAAQLTTSESRPRADIAEDAAFLNLRGRSTGELRASDPLVSIRIWASRGRVVSAARQPLVVMDVVRQKVAAGRVRDPGDLVTALAAAITADLDPEVGTLGDRLDEAEEMIDDSRAIDLRRIVTQARAEAIGYRRFVAPQRQALDRFSEAELDWLDEDDRRHLRAAADRAARMVEELESIRERAALIHEALTDLRAEMLDTRSLTIAIVAMIFLPLTFITGLLGMNVEGIPFAQAPWAFWGVVGLCAAIGLGVGGWFVARHWLAR